MNEYVKHLHQLIQDYNIAKIQVLGFTNMIRIHGVVAKIKAWTFNGDEVPDIEISRVESELADALREKIEDDEEVYGSDIHEVVPTGIELLDEDGEELFNDKDYWYDVEIDHITD